MAGARRRTGQRPASSKRLEAAREEGQVAISRELQSLTAIGFAILAMMMTAPTQLRHFTVRMQHLMAAAGGIDLSGGGMPAVREAALLGVGLAAPPVLAALVGLVGVTLLQTGFLVRPAGLMPQLGRLSPMRGLKRIFGGDNLVETLKALAKLAAFALALRHVLLGLWPVFLSSTQWPATVLVSRTARLVLGSMLTLLAVQAVIAVLDVAWVRYRHASGLRMSRQELRDEHRQTEGDPHVKARIRQLRRQRARRRMMDAVPKATVVITNPTHYAIALAYEKGGKGAPKVVAKGVDELAARIREMALDNKVPLVANPPLARALYTVPLDQEIPREHFQMVAGIIAYVWRLKRPPPGPPPVR